MDEQNLNVRFTQAFQSIARLERKIDFILKELNLEYPDDSDVEAIPPHLVEVCALLKKGLKLQAIQAYQIQTGANLREAKAVIEDIEMRLVQS
jgi:hypothetical protein